MKTFNITSVTKYWKEIAILVLFSLVLFNCNRQHERGGLILSNEDYKDSIKISKQNLTGLDTKIKTSESKLKDLDIQEKNQIQKVQVLEKAVTEKKKEYNTLEEKEKQLHKKIDSYGTNDIAKYIGERYENPTAVSTLPYATVMQDTVGRAVVKDLVSFDVERAKNKIQKNMLADKDSIINHKDSIIEIKDEKIAEHIKINDVHKEKEVEYVKIVDTQEKIITNDSKIIKKEKRKNILKDVVIVILTGLLIFK